MSAQVFVGMTFEVEGKPRYFRQCWWREGFTEWGTQWGELPTPEDVEKLDWRELGHLVREFPDEVGVPAQGWKKFGTLGVCPEHVEKAAAAQQKGTAT